jgi:hypothetical protein
VIVWRCQITKNILIYYLKGNRGLTAWNKGMIDAQFVLRVCVARNERNKGNLSPSALSSLSDSLSTTCQYAHNTCIITVQYNGG